MKNYLIIVSFFYPSLASLVCWYKVLKYCQAYSHVCLASKSIILTFCFMDGLLNTVFILLCYFAQLIKNKISIADSSCLLKCLVLEACICPGIFELNHILKSFNGLKLSQRKFRLDFRKNVFTEKVVKHWIRLPMEVVETPTRRYLRGMWDMALRDIF